MVKIGGEDTGVIDVKPVKGLPEKLKRFKRNNKDLALIKFFNFSLKMITHIKRN